MTKKELANKVADKLLGITFDDLQFEDHQIIKERESAKKRIPERAYKELYGKGSLLGGDAKQCRYKFDNGLGVSVVFGSIFYSNGVDTYEVAVLDKDGNLDGEPEGYLNRRQVEKLMRKVAAR